MNLKLPFSIFLRELHFLSNLHLLFRICTLTFFITLSFSFVNVITAQIKISEKVILISKPKNELPTNLQKSNSIYDDSSNPFYLRYGGTVNLIDVLESRITIENFGYELWEEGIGKLTSDEIIDLGTMNQWSRLVFFIHNPDSNTNYYNNSSGINSSSVDLYFEIPDQYGYLHDCRWQLNILKPDSSLAQIPPAEILSSFDNQFDESFSVKTPPGNLSLFIIEATTNSNNILFTNLNSEPIINDGIHQYIEMPINYGRIENESDFKLYLRSDNTVVSAYNLYSKKWKFNYQSSIGKMYSNSIEFEDWTDQLYNDVLIEANHMPDNPCDFKGEIDVSFERKNIQNGDSVSVFIKKRNEEGILEDFDSEEMFDVKIVRGSSFGTLLNIENGDTADYFAELPSSFKFIAKENIEVDTSFIWIRVGEAPEIIIGKTSNGNHQQAYLRNASSSSSTQGVGVELFDEEEEENFNFNYGFGQITIGESLLDHFKVTIIPDTLSTNDTLAFTETARLFVQAKDADSNDVIIDKTTILRFEVTTNTNYGTFIKPNGDTLTTTPAILENITYTDANSGKIKFAAVKENPDSIIHCNIRVLVQEDGSKRGDREAIILEQTLRVMIEGDSLIVPTYFNRNGVRIGREDDTMKELRILITRGGNPVRNHQFKLFTNYINNSGVHNHQNRRNNINENFGYFLIHNDTTQYRPLIEETDSVGVFDSVSYVSSVIGDSMRIFLHSRENALLKDSVTLIERITVFEELKENDNYVLVGAPGNFVGTNDPCRNNPPASQHNLNHFGTARIIQALQNIANDYYHLHPGIRIRINDMSLENGGLFDVNNDWNNPHRSHRLGQNADIGFTGVDQNNNCVDISRDDLRAIITRHSSRGPLREGDHFHIYVY